ncbi:MAG: tetratricopeptide repeat protein, partial [Myxococcota bacterium]
MRLVEYLLAPGHIEAFKATEQGATRAASLPRFLLIFQSQWAVVLSRLGEQAQASALRRSLIEHYAESGDGKKALEQTLELGRTLHEGREFKGAAEEFERCIAFASEQGVSETEANCRSRLGSSLRELYRYDAAQEAYEAAIAVYRRIDHPDQLEPARYLGFLYENALSDYEAALVQYRFALDAAKRFETQRDKLPGLHLDIARIQRLRGEYEQALENVAEARTRSASDDADQRTAVELESAKVFWYRGSYRRARRAQSRALKQSVRAGNTFLRIQSLSVGGLIAMNQGELEEAESLIRSALELSRLTARRSEEAA